MGFFQKLFFGEEELIKKEKLAGIVDAMIGICVHAPGALIDPPSNIKKWASEVVGMNFKDIKLSQSAKVEFLMTQGSLSFDESEKQAKKDLPELLDKLMKRNSLNPQSYTIKSFSEEFRRDLKILCIAAVK